MKRRRTQEGFIALMSAIIISIILMTMVLTVSTSSFYARFDALGTEGKRESLGLAEGCINVALLRLAQNALYQPALSGDIVAVGDEHCTIDSVTPLSSVYPKTFNIKTRGEQLGAFSNVVAHITMQDPYASPGVSPTPPNIIIDSWEEATTTTP